MGKSLAIWCGHLEPRWGVEGSPSGSHLCAQRHSTTVYAFLHDHGDSSAWIWWDSRRWRMCCFIAFCQGISVSGCLNKQKNSACIHTFFKNICTHTYIHTCMHACIHTYIHTDAHTYIHTCIHTYIHIYIYIYTYIRTYVRTYILTYILTYLHTYILTYLHTYILVYIHTYILTYILTYLHTYLHT